MAETPCESMEWMVPEGCLAQRQGACKVIMMTLQQICPLADVCEGVNPLLREQTTPHLRWVWDQYLRKVESLWSKGAEEKVC